MHLHLPRAAREQIIKFTFRYANNNVTFFQNYNISTTYARTTDRAVMRSSCSFPRAIEIIRSSSSILVSGYEQLFVYGIPWSIYCLRAHGRVVSNVLLVTVLRNSCCFLAVMLIVHPFLEYFKSCGTANICSCFIIMAINLLLIIEQLFVYSVSWSSNTEQLRNT